MTAKLAGTRVFRSSWVASTKALFIITSPVIRTPIPGKRSRTSSARPRANATTMGPSRVSSSPGSRTITLTPLTPPSRAMRRAASRGSARATARIRDRSAASARIASSTRSRTTRSSPSAVVCWKLVRESTRVEYGNLPGPLGEPGSRVEGQGRRGVPVAGDDGEEDVAGLGVRVLQCFEGEELRVVLVEIDAIVRREFEEPRTARRGRDQDQGDRDDRPSRGDDPPSEPCFESRAPSPSLAQASDRRPPGAADPRNDSTEARGRGIGGAAPPTRQRSPLTSGFSARAASGRRSSDRAVRQGRGTLRAASR